MGMYESPIKIIESTIDSFSKAIIKQKDDAIFAEIQSSFGVDLDRKELIRALQYDRNQYEKGYADGKADTMTEWIPVTERLPEDNSHVLAYLRIGEEGRIYPASYAKGMWWDCIFSTPTTKTTTHWMPLPEPPKGE